MRQKIGELLLKENLINEDQLRIALKYQYSYGLRLGSCLVELGMLDGSVLAQLLAKAFGVPQAKEADLGEISDKVKNIIQRKIIVEHGIVPFRLEGRNLCVAVSNPDNIALLDSICLNTGYNVKAYVAPDVLIAKALSSHYGVTSKEKQYRHISLLSRSAPKQQQAEEAASPFGVSAPFTGFAEALDETPATPDDLAPLLVYARSKDEVSELYIDFMAHRFSCGGIFIFRNAQATGWHGFAQGRRMDAFSNVRIPVQPASIFSHVKEKKGAVAAKQSQEFKSTFPTLDPGAGLCAVPLILSGKLVGAVVAADLKIDAEKIGMLKYATEKLGYALEIQLLREKVLAVVKKG